MLFPLQGGINAKLGKHAESPIHASLISFVIGALAIAAYVFLTRQSMSFSGIKSAPAHAWVGGVIGAFVVTVILLAYPKIGPGLTFALLVAGQMTISVVLEHFGILDAPQQSINIYRVGGVALIVAGVILIKQF